MNRLQITAERIKRLKTNYQKVKDANSISVNSPSSCLFYKEFNLIMGTALTTAPPVFHDTLLSNDGDLLTRPSPDESQTPDEGQKATLELRPVTEVACHQSNCSTSWAVAEGPLQGQPWETAYCRTSIRTSAGARIRAW